MKEGYFGGNLSNLVVLGLGVANSTKSAITTILANEFPLSAKEIHSCIKRNYSVQISYQATHKVLNQLVSEKVLIKNNSKYSLSLEWINSLVSFGAKISEKYSPGKHFSVDKMLELLDSGQSIQLFFDSVAEAGDFVIDEYYLKFPISGKKESVCFWRNILMPIGFHDKQRVEALKKMVSRTRHYGITKSNTFFENYLAGILDRLGKFDALGMKYAFDDDIYLCGDYVLQAFFPEKFVKEITAYYRKIKKLEDFKIEKYNELLTKKVGIRIIITKNAELADLFRKQGIELYKKYKFKRGASK